MITVESNVRKSADLIVAEVDDDVVLMHTVSGKFFSLTDTGRRIWDLMGDEVPVTTLVHKVQSEFDVGRAQCEEEVIELLNNLHQRALVCAS